MRDVEAEGPQQTTDHSAFLLRQFVSARARGDRTAARKAWDELLTRRFDTVVSFVRIESHGRLDPDEQRDATARALERIAVDLFNTFRGSSIGEYVNAVRRLVHFACVDTQRREHRHSRNRASITHTGTDGNESLNPELAATIARDAQDADADADVREADGLLYATGREFLESALPKLSDKRRAVIELDLQGVPTEEIEQRLGISRDAVYQNRKRGLDDLVRLGADWRAT